MDYPLENLEPERFQKLCQSLLIREFPQVQCFPVAQPDGGRDATSYVLHGGSDKFLVFQVKFVRKPLAEADPHKWLMAIMEEEAPKIKALIPRGATRYILITNIPGTAHPDVGAIDKLNKLLNDIIGIPSQCWWRDDLNRRLDNSWDLKWVYTELMSGPDFLRLVIDSGLSEQKDRRSAAIKAFIRAQYNMDEEVRFKQVELQNKLLDLFVDVPIALRDSADKRRQHIYHFVFASAITGQPQVLEDLDIEFAPVFVDSHMRWHANGAEKPIGAATLLLSEMMQEHMPHAVIEGAPGQGKSTIAQYICQVHRMRLLNEAAALATIPKNHATAPIRLPIKVDLRDFAVWLGKKDPFSIDLQDTAPPNWNKSLEAFLAALISHQSGGTSFSTDDLLAVARISSLLLALDGLDEVADMAKRHEVVAEILRGVQRLEENAASLQSFVTSRPAAFANSPGMPPEKFPHLQLLSLNRSLIMDYAERWLKARKLVGKQGAEFRSILKEKLDQPHLRDLARNPMQLAILLSLVLTRGASLPDKRTALYEFYIDLFFSREAEKSSVVRNHRDLLIDIHRYLAWLLHTQAEQGDARPSVPQERLQQLVAEYLAREGHDPSLSKELFTGMVERVVALVSRVEGTFEFEVQPLREFFAACHLYYTAPQSSPGKETSGSKPDRFDAIAQNFYWLNVTRFYAGCYSKGELPSLVERLQELAMKSGFDVISHPRTLAATLLGDWVFTQNPRSVQQVVDLVLAKDSLRYVLAPNENRRLRADVQNALVLPPKCGKDELIRRCFERLQELPPRDLAQQLLELLKANSEASQEVPTQWLTHLTNSSKETQLAWLEYGVLLGTLSTIEYGVLHDYLIGQQLLTDRTVLSLLFRARRLDILHSSENVFESMVSLILDRHITAQPQRKVESALDALGHSLDPARYALAFRDRQPASLGALLEQRNRPNKLIWSSQISTETEAYQGHKSSVDLAKVAESESSRSLIEWATEISPWDHIIETARATWGERWAFLTLATVAAGIHSTTERCSENDQLFDHKQSLARRIRYARLRSGAHKWWRTQLEKTENETDSLFVLLPFLTWATTTALLANYDLVDKILDTLSDDAWSRLFVSTRRCIILTRLDEARTEKLERSKMPSVVGIRFAAILCERLGGGESEFIYGKYIKGKVTSDVHILQFAQRDALDLSHYGTSGWKPDLELIRNCYSLGVFFEPHDYRIQRQHLRANNKQMPATIANAILGEPDLYPGFLVTTAEESSRETVASRVTAVAVIAERDKWFPSADADIAPVGNLFTT